ncbi:MAG: MBL fold metallo-hydrolase [Planctomycetia bacterium]|nr:MBL fold metallo-hydrolase [Planctomycetia bacterium]
MKKSLTWLGHNCWLFEIGQTKILIDPYLQTPLAPCKPTDISTDYVLVSHGHSDHCADALSILKQTGATVVAMAEVASWFGQRGIAKTEAMNIGGSIPIPFREKDNSDNELAQLMMIPAFHSSTMPDGTSGGNSCGFLLSFPQNGKTLATWSSNADIKPMKDILADANAFSIYFACDSGYFLEMNQLGSWGIDVAVLPIGDRYTIGPSLSLDAIQSLKPKKVIPTHYNTWKPISQNVQKWAQAVQKYTESEPVIPIPGKMILLGE